MTLVSSAWLAGEDSNLQHPDPKSRPSREVWRGAMRLGRSEEVLNLPVAGLVRVREGDEVELR